MDGVIITSANRAKLSACTVADTLRRFWPVEETGIKNRFVVEGCGSRVYFENDRDPNEPDRIQLVLEHSMGLNLIKKILEIIADDPEFVIDNEFSTVLRGDAFVARLRADPDWDWRADFLRSQGLI